MPIYEFHCAKCERDSEILVRSTKWEGTKCPLCGSPKLSKKLSVFASTVAGDTGECGMPVSSCAMPGGGGCGCGRGGPHRH